MSFVSLQENLRRQLRKRIEAGEMTGMELARRTGFTQAHISNFLNGKRGLKLKALDRTLKAVGLTLYDLLNPNELVKYAAVPPGAEAEYADVPLVEGSIAAGSEVIINEDVKEVLKFRRTFLNRIRAEVAALPGGSSASARARARYFSGGTGSEKESAVSRPMHTANRTTSWRVRRPSFSAIRARYVSTVSR